MLYLVVEEELVQVQSRFYRYPVKGVLCKMTKNGDFQNIYSGRIIKPAEVNWYCEVQDIPQPIN